MGITIKDIARMSGVGVSTVSRVINNTGFTSEATRQKVQAVIDEVGFVPNSSARNLKATSSKTIALLIKDVSNPVFIRMIKVIEEKVAMRGYSLLLINVSFSSNELDVAIQEKNSQNLCGVIIVGGSYQYSDEEFQRLGIPCVLLTISADKSVNSQLYSSVCINDEAEGFKATEYLISMGHRRIAFIFDTDDGMVTPNYLRFQGYKRALQQYNIPYDPQLVPPATPNPSGYKLGFQSVQWLLAKKIPFSAIFTFADVIALGAAKAVLHAGYRIPDDISILGFDGIEAAEFYHPAIDTISQPAEQEALSSINILFDMIQGEPAQHVIYDCTRLNRGSVKRIDGSF